MNKSFFILISILLGLILLTAFYVLPNYQIAKAQTQSGSNKSIWQRLQANITSHPALGRNADGRLEVFAVSTHNHLYHTSQTSPRTTAPLQQQQQQLVPSNNTSTSTEQNLIPFLR
jgi:hypothetical protein